MSLKFNEALHILVKDLPKPPKPEHILYIQDAAEISEKINQELIKMNSIFKGTVSNWEATSKYKFLGINVQMDVCSNACILNFKKYNIKICA